MGRIRTIKPDFFKHEELFIAEKKTNLPLRVAFSGLWTVADREGRFKWKPSTIKLDVLPFDNVSMDEVLKALIEFGFIQKYSVDGRDFGFIPSFKDHQVINHRESQSVIPPPVSHETTCVPTRDDASRGEGKGREGKGKERNILSVCRAVAQIFGRDYVEDPKERLPNISSWYNEIETQANEIVKAYGPENAVRQVVAYVKYCKLNNRKLIGTPYKVAETLLQADWITLSAPESSPRGSPYEDAMANKKLWTDEAWRKQYQKQINSDPEFRKHFQITQ